VERKGKKKKKDQQRKKRERGRFLKIRLCKGVKGNPMLKKGRPRNNGCKEEDHTKKRKGQ